MGYEKGDPAGRGRGDSRNGSGSATAQTEDGRDCHSRAIRTGRLEPHLIAKGRRRFDGFDDKIFLASARAA